MRMLLSDRVKKIICLETYHLRIVFEMKFSLPEMPITRFEADLILTEY